MKIMLVLFKMRNMNADNFELMKNNSYFDRVIVVDDNYEYIENFETSNYDFILFANPNFLIKQKQIQKGIEEIKNKKIKIVQWSLRNINNISNNRYTFDNYREIFSTVLVPNTAEGITLSMESYFKNITYTKSKGYMSSYYIGNNLNNKKYKKDIIDFAIEFFKSNSLNTMKAIFETEHDLIKLLDFLIDNKVFEKEIRKNKQLEYMYLIKEKFKTYKSLTNRKNTPLYLFYGLIFNEYYDEALTSLMLYRSRRYWYHIEQQMTKEIEDTSFNVRSSRAWRKTQKFRNARLKCRALLHILEKDLLKIISKIYKFIYIKPIWLISERKNSASDNSYFLFEYINKNEKNIKSYYIIDEDAKQAKQKVGRFGEFIHFGSFKHKLFMLIASNYITSFTIEETMLPFDAKLYKKIYEKELLKKKVISIQHGMIIHNISPYLSKKNYWIDYITANSVYEKEIIKETLGYNDNEVLITGMSRHDNLVENSVNIADSKGVLFMPTWQRGLQNLSTEQFLESNYYKKLLEMISDPSIIKFLKENGLSLKVLMHPQFEKYVSYLESNIKEIEFLSTDKVEIADMIAQSKFLITDFSSVAVDFLFQQKNVIFYQYNKYASHHVPSTQIKYSDIGQIVTNLDDLKNALEEVKQNNFHLITRYRDSYEKLFEVKQNIRQKTINIIKNLK
ncbi:CDP-glycerol glycerophosphotransferase family protein [Staphylococcus nepalensis]|uniref:CDP-glycerol:poly(Glycerophosphate) glycerophosphotransferase n=2 Tax=Staphylococcus nepalensis TaxID=214473 RepID=A0A380GQI9_9STAP|nr:CDP-glycerol glycerophosphotransferase family protein [Staphylococcus nepalensis]GGB87191.1 hypothetical protein GCM10007203_18000 [Staphylococcus nepalensis]SUM56034.1 CDP-glycerol:poly(glycerophosphate) glycerophosphotransferase [Staphylococcus nepalensis]VDG68010.1 Putative glycosyl/glycerophosphate transferases involved in teichoic acid biosynthesis TagF/TagB/EpsJ/RodC [Lacrimispora indolis]